MPDSKEHLNALRKAYEETFAPPDHTVELRRETGDDQVPTEMDILFFLPEGGPNDDDVTLVATAGMSSRAMSGPQERIELAYEFNGSCTEDEHKTISKQLGELAVLPFRDERHFTPGMVLENLELHPFEKMNHALLMNWDVLAEVVLPGVEPPVVLLRLIPLYESEAKLVDELGAVKAVAKLRHHGLVFEDFSRDPIV